MTFDVSVPSPRSEGVMAQYTCEVGYELANGSAQRICNASFAWDGAEPTCTKVQRDVTLHQLCYNCDIVDSDCPFVTGTVTFEECQAIAINNNVTIVEYVSSTCKTFACDVPKITYTSGNVALFSSLNKGIY